MIDHTSSSFSRSPIQLVSNKALTMEISPRYWQLVWLDANGKTQKKYICEAEQFIQQQISLLLTSGEVSENLMQAHLLSLMNSHEHYAEVAYACLYCYISHIIEWVCIDLENQFGQKHGFQAQDLLALLLAGKNALRQNRQSSVTTNKSKNYILVYDKILKTFEPEKASLATWSRRIIKSDPNVNSFLYQKGVYLLSDWAILNDTSNSQLSRILLEYHQLSQREIEMFNRLLVSYHAVYRRDRLAQRRRGKGSHRCAEPTTNQLQQIAEKFNQTRVSVKYYQLSNNKIQSHPPQQNSLTEQEILHQLQKLASYLRDYRIHIRSGNYQTERLKVLPHQLEIDIKSTENMDLATEEENNFLEFYRQTLFTCLPEAVNRVIKITIARLQAKKEQTICQRYRQAMYLYYCQGLLMKDIAPYLGLTAQYQVSRLLDLRAFDAAIRRELLKQVKSKILPQAKLYANPQRLKNLDREIEAILQEEIDTVIPIQKQGINPVYGDIICQYFSQK